MKRELEGRPLLWLSLALMAGLAFHFYPWVVLAGLLVLAIDRRKAVVLVGLGFLLVGILIGPRPPSLIKESRPYSGEVFVEQAPRPTSKGERALVRASGKRLVMFYSADQPVALGDLILVKGRVSPLDDVSREYWRHQGVAGSLSVSGPLTRVSAGPPFGQWGQSIRRSFVAYTERFMPREPRAIVQAVCFNHDVTLTKEERDLLARSGIIHIISTSGMHVVLLAGFLGILLGYLPIPRWSQIGLLILILMVYGAAAGFRPPMIRSILMASLWYSAYLFKREADGLSITAASAIVTLLVLPSAIFDVGFLLSFTTITALVMFIPNAKRDINRVSEWWLDRIKQTGLSSLIATVASAPILSVFFGRFSVVGVVSNLLIVPVVPVLVAGSLVAWLISGPAPEIARLITSVAVEPLALWCLSVARLFGSQPWASVETPLVPWGFAAAFYVFAVMLWRPRRRRVDE